MRRFALLAAFTFSILGVSSVALAQPDDDARVSDDDLFADGEDEEPGDSEGEGGSAPSPGPDEAGPDEPVAGDTVDVGESVSDDDLFAAGDDDSDSGDDDAAADDAEGDASWTDELSLDWNLFMRSDLRFRLNDVGVGEWFNRQEITRGVDRNENLIGIRMTASYGDIVAKADIDFVVYGFSADVDDLADLSRRERVDPYRFEAHRLYLQARDLFVDGFDLTIGQQLVYWGVGDQFNPTNNLNADDLEDILYFGQQQGNFMVKADYWLTADWQMSAVMVPVFRPALLPRTGILQLARVDRLPLADGPTRWRLAGEQATSQTISGYPTIVRDVNVVLPDKDFDNIQGAFRLGGTLGGQDISLSYYNGRTDFPVPFRNDTALTEGPRCNPEDGNECINGTLDTRVSLHYPRMYVYGLNMAGEIPWLEDLAGDIFNSIGYRLEVAVIRPEQSRLELFNGDLDLGIASIPAGEYDYDGDGNPGGGRPPVVIDNTPFAKWTLGLDYTFNKYIYTNVQWVHGLADEYGAGDWITRGSAVRTSVVDSDDQSTVLCALTRDGTRCATETLRPRLGDYLVTGIDLRFLDQKLLTRIFTILDLSGVWVTRYNLDAEAENPNRPAVYNRTREFFHPFTDEGFGMILYPEIGYSIGNGMELSTGALVQLGKEHGKFGDPAAGGHLVWSRARYTF
jgi:hypothetical protein